MSKEFPGPFLKRLETSWRYIEEWEERDKSEHLGELIRSGVSTEAQKTAQEHKSGKPDDLRPSAEIPAEKSAEHMSNRNGTTEADDSRP